jgi:Protein of unknown function (DUF3887)
VTRPVLKSRHRWLAVLVAALLVAACSSSQDYTLAEAEVAHFRELMARQQFDQIYAEAADELKNATTSQNMTKLLAAIDRKLGAFKTAESNGWKVNFSPSATSVTLQFKAQFERGSGEETFVYRVADGKALLVGYHINSSELITN